MEDTNKKIDDLTKVVLDFAQYVQGQFDDLRGDMKKQFDDLRGDMQKQFDEARRERQELRTDVTRIEATMVTKDYLDDKMADMKGELVMLTRREDEALGELVTTIHRRKGMNDDDAQRVHRLRPFPKTPLAS